MAQSQRKSIRKLVSLSAELAERVEKFQQESGAPSESDALKILIEDGLKMRDRPFDLFQRCENATKSGQRMGDIIERLTSDHPLVETTIVNADGLCVYLKTEPEVADERFYLSRSRRTWTWQRRVSGGYNDGDAWENIAPVNPDEPQKARERNDGLDDEIPF
jgi:hypothetical protein